MEGQPPQQTGYQNPITQQPGSGPPAVVAPGGWMPAPQVIPGCPPGLEYLTQIDQLLIKQKLELAEVFLGCEMNNKYVISNSLGQQVYSALEDTECCTRICCGPGRPFNLSIIDNMQQEVIRLTRPLRCTGCCWPCCLQEIEICGPPGNVLGYVEEIWSLCIPRFEIKDANRETVLCIEGPICTCRCCQDVEFQVLSKDGQTQVGKISKQWTGLIKESFTDADNFGITFPMDLDVKIKAVMIGACFLIDFMYFEKGNNG